LKAYELELPAIENYPPYREALDELQEVRRQFEAKKFEYEQAEAAAEPVRKGAFTPRGRELAQEAQASVDALMDELAVLKRMVAEKEEAAKRLRRPAISWVQEGAEGFRQGLAERVRTAAKALIDAEDQYAEFNRAVRASTDGHGLTTLSYLPTAAVTQIRAFLTRHKETR
jgi:hypothetical protein